MKAEHVAELFPLVQSVWCELYKPSRRGGFERMDRGKRRGKREVPEMEKPTEKDFIKRRRTAVAAVVMAANPGGGPVGVETAVELCGDAWTEKHTGEQMFNARKHRSRQ
eukprot:639829-Prorocentrum_lima.AAC.1